METPRSLIPKWGVVGIDAYVQHNKHHSAVVSVLDCQSGLKLPPGQKFGFGKMRWRGRGLANRYPMSGLR